MHLTSYRDRIAAEVAMMESEPMTDSARFLALEREASRLVAECDRLTDAAIAADAAGDVVLARSLAGEGNACLREARRLRRMLTH